MAEIEKKSSSREITWFKVDDYKFDSETKAKEFIEKAEKELGLTYFLIHHSPDISSGKLQESFFLAVDKELGVALVYEFMLAYKGLPTFVLNGDQVVKNYKINNPMNFEKYKDLQMFLNSKHLTLGEGLQKLIAIPTPKSKLETPVFAQRVKREEERFNEGLEISSLLKENLVILDSH